MFSCNWVSRAASSSVTEMTRLCFINTTGSRHGSHYLVIFSELYKGGSIPHNHHELKISTRWYEELAVFTGLISFAGNKNEHGRRSG